MPKIDIIIDEQGNMQQRFQEFTEEDPACLCAEKVHEEMRGQGFEFSNLRTLSRKHQHDHKHTHTHGF